MFLARRTAGMFLALCKSLVPGLSALGGIWVTPLYVPGYSPLEEYGRKAPGTAGVTLAGPPSWHPERLVSERAPSAVEEALWRDLGWRG